MDSNASLDSSFHAHWRAAWTCTSMYRMWTVFVSTVLTMHVQIGSHALTPNFEGGKETLEHRRFLIFPILKLKSLFLRFATFGYCTGICFVELMYIDIKRSYFTIIIWIKWSGLVVYLSMLRSRSQGQSSQAEQRQEPCLEKTRHSSRPQVSRGADWERSHTLPSDEKALNS